MCQKHSQLVVERWFIYILFVYISDGDIVGIVCDFNYVGDIITFYRCFDFERDTWFSLCIKILVCANCVN